MENVDDDREGVRVFNLSSPIAGRHLYSMSVSSLLDSTKFKVQKKNNDENQALNLTTETGK